MDFSASGFFLPRFQDEDKTGQFLTSANFSDTQLSPGDGVAAPAAGLKNAFLTPAEIWKLPAARRDFVHSPEGAVAGQHLFFFLEEIDPTFAPDHGVRYHAEEWLRRATTPLYMDGRGASAGNTLAPALVGWDARPPGSSFVDIAEDQGPDAI